MSFKWNNSPGSKMVSSPSTTYTDYICDHSDLSSHSNQLREQLNRLIAF
jgi:hypothetical protein